MSYLFIHVKPKPVKVSAQKHSTRYNLMIINEPPPPKKMNHQEHKKSFQFLIENGVV